MLVNQFSKSTLMLLLCGMLFSGCFTKENRALEDVDPIISSEVSEANTKPSPAPEATATLSKPSVNVYLEISNGMKGFMPALLAGRKPTEFQARVDKILSDVQYGDTKSKAYFFAKEDKQGAPALDSTTFDVLKKTITSGSNENVLGTPLPSLLKAALEKSVEQKSVSIIISDFIHGPKPEDKGQFISMSTDIRGSLQVARDNDLVIAVFADVSSFYGSYHPAVKVPEIKRKLNGEAIPYYIWVVGTQQDVQFVINKVLRKLPAQQAYYGFTYATVPYAALLKDSNFKPSGIIYCNDVKSKTCKDLSLDPQSEEPVEFVVGLDLNSLPKSMQGKNYLKSHLKISSLGCKASIIEVAEASGSTKTDPALANYSHFVRLRVPQLSSKSGTIKIILPHVNPNWVKAWSTENDNDPVANPKKTFQFNKIIEGVQDLYRGRKQDVFSATVKFNKA